MSRNPLSVTFLLVWTWMSHPCDAEPAAAKATDEPLPVIGITCSGNKEQGEALTWALRKTLDASVEWKTVEARQGVDALLSAANCPELPNHACLARIARNIGSSRFLWGALKLTQGRVFVQLSLFNGEADAATAQLEYSATMIDTFDENLLRLANNGLVRLLGPIHFPVQVRSREQQGTIVIDDVVSGNLDSGVADIAVTAGDHRFRLVLPDATVVARTFHVRIDSTNHLRLDFLSIPES